MSSRRILISPLNWGFGHAGRMIPLALELRKRGHDIIFGVDRSMMTMVTHELPGIRIIEIPGVRMRYSRHLPQYINVLFRLPHLLAATIRERFTMKRLVDELHPDIIISDNRFGLFHNRVFSVYVTHMLRVPFPSPFRFLEPAGIWLHRKLIEQYDLCLIPDYPGKRNLSGRLSHGMRLPYNAIYAGPLSRFNSAGPTGSNINLPRPYRCLILSGPEPQRSMLKEKVIAATSDKHLVILSGTGEQETVADNNNITVVSNPDTTAMKNYITNSSLVISRSGYTTIMELVSLRKGAVIIPTPGQTEQEYLGEYLGTGGGFVTVSQNETDSIRDIPADIFSHAGFDYPDTVLLLENALKILFEKEK